MVEDSKNLAEVLEIQRKQKRDEEATNTFNVKAIAGILNDSNASPEMREEFINMTVFDLMIGNNEGHAKSFSLMYKDDGKFEFGPRQIISPARFLPGAIDRLAYFIGNAETLEQITADDFNIFLSTLGIKDPSEQKEIRNKIVLDLGHKFASELDDMESSGQKDFADFIATNVRHLFKEFDLEIPESVEGRDEYRNNANGLGNS